ncbi:MAG: hypothetical protein Q9207_004515 [Kuettlingeria erythrocarpa]
MSNMTWDDGIKHFFSTYFAAPRMWPVGYILGSPYSPLHLERDIPTKNWRDPFEDLLALQSRGVMIDDADRKAEDHIAALARFKDSSYFISTTNQGLEDIKQTEAKLQKRYAIAAERNETAVMDIISNEILPVMRQDREKYIALGQSVKADYDRDLGLTASCLKPRGQWIAALMNSGAVPNWTWRLFNSTDGPVTTFSTSDDDTPSESFGVISISEHELTRTFEDNQPFDISCARPVPPGAMKALLERDHDIRGDQLYEGYTPHKSIVAQSASSEAVTLPDGSKGWKTTVRNELADDTSVTKTFLREPGKLYAEIMGGWRSMALTNALFTSRLDDGSRGLALHEAFERLREQEDGEASVDVFDD